MRERPPEGFPYTTHSYKQPSMHSTQSLTRSIAFPLCVRRRSRAHPTIYEPCAHATPYPCEPRTLPRPRPIPLAREPEECPSLYIFPHSAHTPASHALAYGAHTLHTTPLPVLRVHGSHLLCVRALRKASHTQHTASHSHPCIAHSPSHAQLPCRYAPEVSMRARADKSSSIATER